MSLKRVMWWFVFAFIVYFVVRAPAESGNLLERGGLLAGDLFAMIGDHLVDLVPP